MFINWLEVAMFTKRKHSHDKPGRDFLMTIVIIMLMYGLYTLNL